MVLTPTRELAVQISEQFGALGALMGLRHTVVIGGVGALEQSLELSGTPTYIRALLFISPMLHEPHSHFCMVLKQRLDLLAEVELLFFVTVGGHILADVWFVAGCTHRGEGRRLDGCLKGRLSRR